MCVVGHFNDDENIVMYVSGTRFYKSLGDKVNKKPLHKDSGERDAPCIFLEGTFINPTRFLGYGVYHK